MSSENRLPVSLRYLKARLRILKRPKVWGSVAGLMLVILFIADYWGHPERYDLTALERSSAQANRDNNNNDNNNENSTPTGNDTISAENQAIGADIDTLPLLLNNPQGSNTAQSDRSSPTINVPEPAAIDLSPTPPHSANATPPTASLPAPGNALSLLGPSNPATPGSIDFNPFDRVNAGQSTGQSIGQSTNAPNTTQPNSVFGSTAPATQAPVSQLQTAIERYSTPANLQEDSAGDRSASTSLQPSDSRTTGQESDTPRLSPGQTPPRQLLPGQPPYNQIPSPYFPQTSPPPGTTGYTLPPSLNSTPYSNPTRNSTYPNSTNSQSIPGLSAPQIVPSAIPLSPGSSSLSPIPSGYGANSSYGSSGYQVPNYIYPNSPTVQPQPVQPPPAPFSVPRSVGNGRINTFSNP